MGQRGLRALSLEVERFRLLAGLTPAEGPGVLVELADNFRPLESTEDPDDVILHQMDLVRVAAIGDAGRLVHGTDAPGGTLAMLRAFGFPVQLSRPCPGLRGAGHLNSP